MNLAQDVDFLDLVVRGEIYKKMRLDIEVRIMDANGRVLALYSPGHLKGYANEYKEGNFRIEESNKFAEEFQ